MHGKSAAAVGALLVAAAWAWPVHAQDAGDSFDSIVSATTQQNHAQARERMLRWIDAHPADPQVARGLLWVSVLDRSDGQGERARPLLERARRDGAGTDWANTADKQLADLDVEAHRYSRAIATYDRLAQLPAPFWKYVGKSAGDEARSKRARFYALLVALGGLLLIALARLVRMGPRALWPMPKELAYPLPALLVILLASLSLEPAEGFAVVVLAPGAIALLWVNGAWLRARPPRGAARWGQALLGVVQACALFYCAIIASNLWEKLVDTWQMGAD